MKIIDLLNKIANGEIDRNNKYQFSRDNYCTINTFFDRYIIDEENLNLEIIEEKKIPEKFKVHSFGDKDENGCFVSSPFPTDEEFMNKINYIIDYLQYLKNKGE